MACKTDSFKSSIGSVMFSVSSAFSYRICQASQDRLLLPENRVEMGGRFARSQMASLGQQQKQRWDALGSLQPPASSAQLLELIHKELQQIPEDQLRTSSRKNVRPDGEKVTLQMALGLVTSAHWHQRPARRRISTCGYSSLSLRMCRCVPGSRALISPVLLVLLSRSPRTCGQSVTKTRRTAGFLVHWHRDL